MRVQVLLFGFVFHHGFGSKLLVRGLYLKDRGLQKVMGVYGGSRVGAWGWSCFLA